MSMECYILIVPELDYHRSRVKMQKTFLAMIIVKNRISKVQF